MGSRIVTQTRLRSAGQHFSSSEQWKPVGERAGEVEVAEWWAARAPMQGSERLF